MSDYVHDDDNYFDPVTETILNIEPIAVVAGATHVDHLVPFQHIEGRNPSAKRPDLETVDGVSEYCTVSLILNIYSHVTNGNEGPGATTDDLIYNTEQQGMVNKPVNFDFYSHAKGVCNSLTAPWTQC